MRQRNKNDAISRICTGTIFTASSPDIKKMFEVTLTTEMRQCTFDCYDIIERSACVTQASKFYIALTQASMICNGNRIAACRVSVNEPQRTSRVQRYLSVMSEIRYIQIVLKSIGGHPDLNFRPLYHALSVLSESVVSKVYCTTI